MKTLLLVCALIFSFAASNAQKFTPQDEGSKVHFVVKNIGINTGGDLSGLKGSIVFDAKKPAKSSFNVTAAVSTVDTDNDKRDEHLKKEEYFNAEKYPVIEIKSTGITAGKDLKNFTFKGNVIIKGVSKPIEFPFTAEGLNGGAVFTGEFEIDRNDFGVGNKGGVLSDKVKVSLKVFAK
jgi:polyisoprenoid-binding protein YceI